MTLYLEPSSMFKIYIEESDTSWVRHVTGGGTEIASSALSYAEMRAALAAAARAQPPRITDAEYAAVRANFEMDWLGIVQVWPDAELVRRAGELAETHRFRGYDAVHLASALVLRESLADDVAFLTHDRRSHIAARAELLAVPEFPNLT